MLFFSEFVPYVPVTHTDNVCKLFTYIHYLFLYDLASFKWNIYECNQKVFSKLCPFIKIVLQDDPYFILRQYNVTDKQ
jgi:hypothetical protein